MDWLDLRHAARRLGKNLRFTGVAVATLAVGIGACTAIFSVVYGVMLKPLPYPSPSRLVRLWQISEKGNRGNFSGPNYEDISEQSRSFRALAQYGRANVSVAGGSLPVRVLAATVSGDFFDVLGIEPRVGRLFVPEELHEGGSPAAIVGHGYWQRYLGGEDDLSAFRLRFNGRVYAVVGVMPSGFSFPPGAELWLPSEQNPRLTSRTAHNWHVLGRLKDGVSLDQARSDLSTIARRLKQTHGDDTWMVDAVAVPLHEELVGPVSRALIVLMAAVGFLLLVACANVMNLLLARAVSRQREIAISAALGAGRWRLAKLFLGETLLLSMFGAALGMLFAKVGVDLLLTIDPGRLPRSEEISVNGAVLLFAAGISLSIAMSLGFIAAWRSTRILPQEALKEGQQSQMGGVSGRHLRTTLVVSQIGITLVLLFGAGLLARSLFKLLEVDAGFRVEKQLIVDLFHPPASDAEARQRLSRLHAELLDGLSALPGVARAGGIDLLPMASGYRNGLFLVMKPGETVSSFEDFGRLVNDPARVGEAEYRSATASYFRAMGIPLVGGRLFDERDSYEGRHVALISESLAKAKWPDRDPLGQLIEFGNMDGDLRLMTVVGVVGDVRHGGLDQAPRPTVYTHALQRPPSNFSVVMDVNVGSNTVLSAARKIVHDLSPDVPPRFRTVEQLVSRSFAGRRFQAMLLSVFGGTALLLACLGIYGVASYSVSQRTREFGLRIALGARPGDVLGLVLRQGAVWVGLGVALGVLGSFALSRAMVSLLFDLSALDPSTFALVVLPLVTVALAACYFPARRATRVDPMTTLRHE